MSVKHFIQITKPGIIFGNVLSVAGGFFLASKGHVDLAIFLAAMIGTSLVVASGCVFNNCIDRDIDLKMERTKNRVLVQGLMPRRPALILMHGLSGSGKSVVSSGLVAVGGALRLRSDEVRAHIAPGYHAGQREAVYERMRAWAGPALQAGWRVVLDATHLSRAERVAASVTRAVERFESFYGRLDENQRRLVAGLSISAPADRIDENWVPRLRATASEISSALGFRGNEASR